MKLEKNFTSEEKYNISHLTIIYISRIISDEVRSYFSPTWIEMRHLLAWWDAIAATACLFIQSLFTVYATIHATVHYSKF